MRCDEVRERLDALEAGELNPAGREAVAAHLGSCATCRAEAGAWRRLFAEAAALPRAIEPPRDLWPAIDARLDEPVVRPLRRRIVFRLPALAAAAVALVVLTAAATTFLLRSSDTAMARKLKGQEPSVAAEPRSEDLLRVLAAQDLPPRTMAVVERNLAVIDAAIAELEGALAEDPGNEELAKLLVSTHRKRAELIDGAARSREGG